VLSDSNRCTINCRRSAWLSTSSIFSFIVGMFMIPCAKCAMAWAAAKKRIVMMIVVLDSEEEAETELLKAFGEVIMR
jgi:hypothetical protein